MTVLRVVVSSTPDRKHWVNDLMSSLPAGYGKYVDVYMGWNYETGAIRYGAQSYERFLLLQDSVVIHREEFFEQANQFATSLLIPRPSCYLGVYDSTILRKMDIPLVQKDDKEASIRHETEFVDAYCRLAVAKWGYQSMPVIYEGVTDYVALANNDIHEVHGEPRLHLRMKDHATKRKFTYR